METYKSTFGTHEQIINLSCYLSERIVAKWDISEVDRKVIITTIGSFFSYAYINEFLYHSLQFVDWSEKEKKITVGLLLDDVDIIVAGERYKILIDFILQKKHKVLMVLYNYVKDGEIVDEPAVFKSEKLDEFGEQVAYAMHFKKRAELGIEYTDEEDDDDGGVEYHNEVIDPSPEELEEFYLEQYGTASDYMRPYIEKLEKTLKKHKISDDDIRLLLKTPKRILQSAYDRGYAGFLGDVVYVKNKDGFSFKTQYDEEFPDDVFGNLTLLISNCRKDKQTITVFNNTPFILVDRFMQNESRVLDNTKLFFDIYDDYYEKCDKIVEEAHEEMAEESED